MAFNEELATRIRQTLEGREGVTERKMFGGIGFMLYGNMCCGVVKDDLMVRVDAEAHEDSSVMPYARPMDFTGRPMKGFVFVDALGVNNDDSLKQWINRGLTFAQSLPRK